MSPRSCQEKKKRGLVSAPLSSMLWAVLLLTPVGIAHAEETNTFFNVEADLFQSSVESLLTSLTNYDVSINGPLDWHENLPLGIRAKEIVASNAYETIRIKEIVLAITVDSWFTPLDSWRVQEFFLYQAHTETAQRSVVIESFTVSDLGPNSLSKFSLSAFTHAKAPDAKPLQMSMNGSLSYVLPTEDSAEQPPYVALNDTRITAQMGKMFAVSALCDAQLSNARSLETAQNTTNPRNKPAPSSIIPVQHLLDYKALANCNVEPLSVNEHNLGGSVLTFSNGDGRSQLTFSSDDILDGKWRSQISVDLRQDPLRWSGTASVDALDSGQLADRLQQPVRWTGPITATVTAQSTGNEPASVLAQLQARANFEIQPGLLDFSEIKAHLNRSPKMSALSNNFSWPDVLRYQVMQGKAKLQKSQIQASAQIDNMAVSLAGTADLPKTYLNTHGTMAINPPQLAEAKASAKKTEVTLPAAIVDHLIPIHCKGSIVKPVCQIK